MLFDLKTSEEEVHNPLYVGWFDASNGGVSLHVLPHRYVPPEGVVLGAIAERLKGL